MTSNGAKRHVSPKQLKRFKQQATKLKKTTGCTHADALDSVARQNGFPNWKAVLKSESDWRIVSRRVPDVSLGFIETGEVSITEDDVVDIALERVEDIEENSKALLVANRRFLASKGIEFALFEPTRTGLKKSILDATGPVRTYFELCDFHFYGSQGQGEGHKVVKDAFFLRDSEIEKTKVSLYRPVTKSGDPRMWFRGLASFAPAESQVAIVVFEGCLYLLNLTSTDLAASFKEGGVIGGFLDRYIRSSGNVALELLEKLRKISRTPLPALGKGDTAVGMAIEAALGISANSSKMPDYKGIELKSYRGVKNRSTLFAQVAEWEKSVCRSSKDILDKFGYEREDEVKLYCTVSTQRVNSQGLYFKYDASCDELWEVHESSGKVAVWSGSLLRARLREKHSETFWIQVESELVDGVEYFLLKTVEHTKSPLLNQLMPLIESGVVTMDHLIKKKKGPAGRVNEKGPLFKINKKDLPLLFPEPVKYSLTICDQGGL